MPSFDTQQHFVPEAGAVVDNGNDDSRGRCDYRPYANSLCRERIRPVATAVSGPSLPRIFPRPATVRCASASVTSCGTSKSSDEPPTSTTNGITLRCRLTDPRSARREALVTKTRSLANGAHFSSAKSPKRHQPVRFHPTQTRGRTRRECSGVEEPDAAVLVAAEQAGSSQRVFLILFPPDIFQPLFAGTIIIVTMSPASGEMPGGDDFGLRADDGGIGEPAPKS